jgi:hypothetical protein
LYGSVLDIIAACVWLIIPAFGQLLFQLNDILLSLLMWVLKDECYFLKNSGEGIREKEE